MNNHNFRSAAIAVVCVVAALTSRAHAHAFLDHADPPVGATLDKSPAEIKIWFTAEVDPDESTLQLFDAQNNPLDKNDIHRDPTDKTLLMVSIPALPPGQYTIRWHATTVADHHKTKGDYKFQIKAP
jgi:methionine-rich copper-binding protein CopC